MSAVQALVLSSYVIMYVIFSRAPKFYRGLKKMDESLMSVRAGTPNQQLDSGLYALWFSSQPVSQIRQSLSYGKEENATAPKCSHMEILKC